MLDVTQSSLNKTTQTLTMTFRCAVTVPRDMGIREWHRLAKPKAPTRGLPTATYCEVVSFESSGVASDNVCLSF